MKIRKGPAALVMIALAADVGFVLMKGVTTIINEAKKRGEK